jgi:hypothetical protein
VPIGLAFDSAGNLYVAWQLGPVPQPNQDGVLEVSPSGVITSLVAGLFAPAVALDSNGTLYVTDAYTSRVDRLTATGATVTVAGSTPGFSGDGGPATAAQLAGPTGMFIDFNGFLLIADQGNNRIRRVTGPSCTGAAEPVVTVPLPAGFYIAEVTNAPGSRNGYWGLVASVPQGSIPGGINLGGGILGNDSFPGYAAFTIPASQTVTINVSAQAGPFVNPFFTTTIYARLLDSNRQLVGAEVSGAGSLQLTNTLGPGFYILEVHTEANGPAVAFQASVLTPSVTGGMIAGGYVSQGALGYGAFSITQAQNVTFQLTGPTDGQFGAGCLQFTLLDVNRNVVKTAP